VHLLSSDSTSVKQFFAISGVANSRVGENIGIASITAVHLASYCFLIDSFGTIGAVARSISYFLHIEFFIAKHHVHNHTNNKSTKYIHHRFIFCVHYYTTIKSTCKDKHINNDNYNQTRNM